MEKQFCKVELTCIYSDLDPVIIIRPTEDPGYPFVYKDTIHVDEKKKRGMQRKLLNLFNNHPKMVDWIESHRLVEAAALPAFRDGYFKSCDDENEIDEAIIRWCSDHGYFDDDPEEDDYFDPDRDEDDDE